MACQAENNVPVVGREQVLRGREMHWIRHRPLFPGRPAQAKVVFQPCLSAMRDGPLRGSLPGGRATVHSQEGLNDMAYNRCIGVRYCANNCPFKVRRFNFFNYHKDLNDPANEVLKMAYNPRGHGSLPRRDGEVHLLRAANSGRQDRGQEPSPGDHPRRPDQDRLPAGMPRRGHCLRRSESIRRAKWPSSTQSPRAYQMLAELNIQPRTSYLTRIRNPNPELKDV